MKKIFRIAGIVVVCLLLVIGAYISYVFINYDRIPDDKKIEIKSINSKISEKTRSEIKLDDELKITSYNVGFGAYSRDYDFFMDGGSHSRALSKEAVYTNINGAANAIMKANSDFAYFQEVDFDSTRSYKVDERKAIADSLAKAKCYDYDFAQNYNSSYIFYPIFEPHGQNNSGIMTFSNYKIDSAVRKSVPVENGLSKLLDLDRCYSKSYVKVSNGVKLVLYNLHFSAYTSKSATAEIQLEEMLKDMEEEYKVGNYCLAGGDFNRDLLKKSPKIFHCKPLKENWAKPIPDEMIEEPLKLVVPYTKQTNLPTCRDSGEPYHKGMFVVTLDGFIVSENIEVTKSDVIDTGFKYSDHNPVYMKFRLK